MKYEAHITVEPMQAEGFYYEDFADAIQSDGWRASKFDHDDVDGIAGKWFMSYASDDRLTICAETRNMVRRLKSQEFTVLRWKVEETLFDSKHGDQLEDAR